MFEPETVPRWSYLLTYISTQFNLEYSFFNPGHGLFTPSTDVYSPKLQKRDDFFEIDVLSDPSALDRANVELGLAFDATDLAYYKKLFVEKLKR